MIAATQFLVKIFDEVSAGEVKNVPPCLGFE